MTSRPRRSGPNSASPTTSDRPAPRAEVPPGHAAASSASLTVTRRIRDATEALRAEPRPHGVKALTGQHGWLRIRVGDYRIVYEVRDSELVVLVADIGHRGQVYER
jgi:mRNA-degrading endonuclease RelE of RelBE toxin-antitoxin system